MIRRKIVAGNWKMNTSLEEAQKLVKEILQTVNKTNEVEKIIFPPFPYLKTIADQLKNESTFSVGAQNCNDHDKGAYTGEVSAGMVRSVGGEFVIIGHSERRTYFNEGASQLIAKIKNALENELNVVFCFGEQLNERKQGEHFVTVKKQLEEVLSHFPENKTKNLILAYEPVWAIGTGETASPEQAQEMHAFVRATLSEIYDSNIANSTSILYGGSCNAQNAKELFSCADVDGGLIGGASLKAEDFCKIIDSF